MIKKKICKINQFLMEKLSDEYDIFANELITEYQKHYEFPPLDVKNLAVNILNIEVKEDYISSLGYSLKLENEPIIILNKRENYTKNNYTCAHEIAHIFFHKIFSRTINKNFKHHSDEWSIKLPNGNKNELKLSPSEFEMFIKECNKNTFARDKETALAIEKLCESFASDILLPQKEMENYVQNIEDNFSIDVFEEIAQSYNVNMQPLFIKVHKYKLIKNPNRFILKLTEKKGIKGRKKKLRVTQCVFPVNSNFYIPLDIGADTLGLKGISDWITLNPSEEISAEESIHLIIKNASTKKWQSNKTVKCKVQYKCYGSEKNNSIIGLFEIIR
jgi:Zn-dependent peptidase ImmA (M78 family)